MSKELEIAIKAAKQAGKISMKYFRKEIEIEKKQDNSPVTIADKLCEKAIIKTIKSKFPKHAFLGEEGGKQGKSDSVWIIDPIDGTHAFSRGLPNFGTLIALKQGNEIVAGAMFLPFFNDLFTAEKGKGAFLNGKKISVSKISKLEDSFVCFDLNKKYLNKFPDARAVLETCRRAYFFRFDGGIGPLSNIACGRAEGSVSYSGKPWDLAAPKIIIEEAGGKFTDADGTDFIDSGNYVFSNGKIHEELLEIVRGAK